MALQRLDTFGQGLPDNFRGTVTRSWLAPGKFRGQKKDNKAYYLFHYLEITPHADADFEDPWTEPYQVGYLNSHAPSVDGEEPVGANWETYKEMSEGGITIPEEDMPEYEGHCIVNKGTGELPYNTGFNHLWSTMVTLEADVNPERVDQTFLGLDAMWSRMSNRDPKKPLKPGEKDYKNLVPSDIFGKADVKKKKGGAKAEAVTKKGGVKKSSKPVEEEDEEETEGEGDEPVPGMRTHIVEKVKEMLEGKEEPVALSDTLKHLLKVIDKKYRADILDVWNTEKFDILGGDDKLVVSRKNNTVFKVEDDD